MDHYPQDPNEAPDWAFGPDTGITCPECDTALSGLNWKLEQPDLDTDVEIRQDEEPEIRQDEEPETLTAEARVTAMILIPCNHELSTNTWELTFSGRDRQMGTVIRTPKFQRKNGS